MAACILTGSNTEGEETPVTAALALKAPGFVHWAGTADSNSSGDDWAALNPGTGAVQGGESASPAPAPAGTGRV